MLIHVLYLIMRACVLNNWPAHAHTQSLTYSIDTDYRYSIQLKRQSFKKVGTVIADGGTRDKDTNIVTVPLISGQLPIM